MVHPEVYCLPADPADGSPAGELIWRLPAPLSLHLGQLRTQQFGALGRPLPLWLLFLLRRRVWTECVRLCRACESLPCLLQVPFKICDNTVSRREVSFHSDRQPSSCLPSSPPLSSSPPPHGSFCCLPCTLSWPATFLHLLLSGRFTREVYG